MNRRDAITLFMGIGAVAPCARATSGAVDVAGYGMRPDAAPATNTVALQRCLNSSAGGHVTIPGADADYRLSGRILVPANTAITLGDGARLRWVATEPSGTPFLRSPTRPGIEVLGGGFRLSGNGKIVGPSAKTYVPNEMAILCIGNGVDDAYRGFEISDGVDFSGWGSQAVVAQFVRDVRIVRIQIHDCGYAGLMFLSCESAQILHNNIGAIGPGTSGNAYGISCTHDSLNYDADPQAARDGRRAKNPFCIGFEVAGNTVYDVPSWSGIAFHGAYDCDVHDNNVYNCRHGVLVESSSGMAVDYAGEHNSVTNNTVTTRQMNGNPTMVTAVPRLGISVNGGRRVYQRSVVVRNNRIDGFGDSRHTSFSLQHTFTSGVEIANNLISDWRGYGCYSAYSSGVIESNEFGSVADSAGTACIFVAIGGDLRIIGNRHVVGLGQGAQYGLYINSPSDRAYLIEDNDFGSATLRQYAGAGGRPLPPNQIVQGR